MRILIGMSGGLDSTYVAWYLKQQGHEVEGAVLRMHECTEIDAAMESAKAVGIKLHIIDCIDQFKKYVIDNFISEYSLGRTPNPCIMCNRYVKVATLVDFALKYNFDKVSTGHYALIEQDCDTNRFYVRRSDDMKKDQSYVLWQLTQKQLSILWTPLSHMKKTEIRENALKLGFKAADRAESQEICFIPDDDYVKYIENSKGKFSQGNFIDQNGKVVGIHKGIIRYTVGQRKGLGLSMGQPVFIININPNDNTITIAPSGGEFSNSMEVHGLVFQAMPPTSNSLELDVKIRYAATPLKAQVLIKNDTAYVKFIENARAITPGQSAVFYKNDKIMFGGFIKC